MSKWRGGVIRSTQITPGGSDETAAASGVWRASDAAYWVKQGQWPTPAVLDSYFPYNILLLNGNGLQDARNNTFVDSSSVYSPVTRYGNATQGSFSPYGSNWSNHFDGSGDNLSLSGNSAFSIATSSTPFTIESWIYPTAAGGCIFSESYTGAGDTVSISVIMADGSTAETNGQYVTLGFYNGSAWSLTRANTQVSLNTWTHIACVFTGSTSKIYYNGVDVTASSPITSWGVTGDAGDAWYVGQRWDTTGTAYFKGFISNLRFVNGTAVYTSAFTPPTSPLAAISGTALLTCQSNRFRDASTNNFTTTNNGDTKVVEFSPFAAASRAASPLGYYNQNNVPSWSNYFDGNGDNLTISNFSSSMSLGTSDFTIEFWVYPSTGPNNNWSPFMTIGNSGGGQEIRLSQNINGTGWGWLYPNNSNNGDNYVGYGTLPINQWHHIAMVRSGSTLYLFRNGTQVATATSVSFNHTNTTLFRVAMPQTAYADGTFNGYISNLRIVKGTALYTSAFTPPTSQLTAVSGTVMLTCQSPALTDRSSLAQTFTVNGDVVPTGFSPFNGVGNYSAYFDGNGDYLDVASNAAFGFSTGDFTVEGWFYATAPTSGNKVAIDCRSGQNWVFGFGNGVTPYYYDGSDKYATSSMNVNTWNHVAWVRQSGNVYMYLNGVSVFTATASSVGASSSNIKIGADVNGGYSQPLYMSNVRVVKGTAVYTSNFTPPTSPLTAIANTSLLTLQDNRFIDNSSNAFTITVTGDSKTQTFNPFTAPTALTNCGSIYLDGSGDFLTAPHQNVASSWTLEFWWYPTNGVASQQTLVSFNNGSYQGINIWSNSSAQLVVDDGATGQTAFSTTTFRANQWNHVAIVRNGSTTTGYINGVAAGSNSFTPQTVGYISVGRYNSSPFFYAYGYISDLRFVNGTVVYSSAFTPPTTPVLPTPNTTFKMDGLNAAIADLTSTSNFESVGDVKISTTVSKYGGSSIAFDGSGDWLLANAPTTNLYSFGTGDFTIEAWVYVNSISTYGGIIDTRSGAIGEAYAFGVWSTSGNRLDFLFTTSGTIRVTSASTFSTGQWNHFAVTRASGTIRLFINGVLDANTATFTGAIDCNRARPIIGAVVDPYPLNGYIDDLRVTRGVARYTTTFTPPTAALPTR